MQAVTDQIRADRARSSATNGRSGPVGHSAETTQLPAAGSRVATLAEEIAAERRIPSATYRLQFNRGFTFRDAERLVPYLHDLGISDCYASPLFKARPDSSHGYDICDHTQLNPAIGTQAEFDAFHATLRARGMGLLLDTVPNHMGIGEPCNVWWMDVLENGPSSVYADFFDVDWLPVKNELRDKVLLPLLDDQYGAVLESGRIRLAYEDGAFFILLDDSKLPVAPHSYSRILGHRLDALVAALGEEHEHVQELQSILTALSYLPPPHERSPERVVERNREKEVVKRRIAALYQASAAVRAAVDEAVAAFNGNPGEPASFDRLDDLLDDQPYRLAYWRVAADEINYRRFFDVNDLAAIRVELPEVFQATHDLLLRLLAEGKVTGVRIDHPDGLWDPPAYFRRLQERYLSARVRARLGHEADADDEIEDEVARWLASRTARGGATGDRWPLYVVAEKVLARGESLPDDWAISGTTGYDFANAVNGLFVDPSNSRAFDELYSRFIGARIDYRDLVNSTRKMTMLVLLASEINVLGHQLDRVSERNRRYRDFTLNSLTFALREVIAALPVYRTYITDESGDVTRQEQAYVEAAVAEAKRRNPRTAASLFDFIRETLLLRNLDSFRPEDRAEVRRFVMRFQQMTAPVMAKGIEDTAFYVYNRLVSLNEVGGAPEQFGVPVAAFHRQNAERLRRWPHALLATSTHDTKRSEDVRARIDVLSELPREWRAALGRWSRLNRRRKTRIDGQLAPSRNDEYLLYQTLLGAWPTEPVGRDEYRRFVERIAAYMLKATREAKVHTSWVNPNEAYDAAVRSFVLQTLGDGGSDPFLDDFRSFQRRVDFFGRFNSLAQTLLKLTSPGVPDVYQGNEIWDYSLVDPDNRRPIDFDRRRALLDALKTAVDQPDADLLALARDLLETSQDGRIKLYLTYRTLNFRRAHQPLFAGGSYLPLEASGAGRDHVVAFARCLDGQAALVVVPRLVVRLTAGSERPPTGAAVWGDTWLALPDEPPGRRYRNLFTGETLAIAERDGTPGLALAAVLAHFPVALLARAASSTP